MPKWLWTERTFNFDFPATKFPDLLERWRGTPARIEDRLSGVSRDLLTRRDRAGWSIQQNIGHLIDLGCHPRQRLDEILAGKSVLCAADMTNAKTNEADHNARSCADLLAEFRAERTALVERFAKLPESDWERAARHPRLDRMMRVVDLLYFDSEHDDYHLGRIGEILGRSTR